MSLLEVRGLTIRYGAATAVDELSFRIQSGDSLGIVGESGSGKSQTALALMGLLPPAAAVGGSILFDGSEIIGTTEQQLNGLRARRMAMVFQDPSQALNPYLKIGTQLGLVLRAHGLAGDATGARDSVIAMLARVGLPDPERQYDSFPHQLSGGMRQRAMIASALITEPDLLIADEPTTALDVTVQAQILELLEEIRDRTALLLITHDLGVIAGHCERVVVLHRGRCVDAGPTRSVFDEPQHEHTKDLLSSALRLDADGVATRAGTGTVLEIANATVTYAHRRKSALHAVRGVNVSVADAETVAVVGESGSGKSSLARAMVGLVPMQAGSVRLRGESLAAAVEDRPGRQRRKIQLVFQDPQGSLNPQMRVERIVGEPLLVHEPELSGEQRRERIVGMLEQVGLGPEFLRRFPHQLSGGQAQRIAMARALILQPEVLLCDEAVAALDGTVRRQILEQLGARQRETGLAIVFISHDLAVVRSIAHRVLVMYMGALVEWAENEQLFRNPKHPYTRAMLEAVPVPDPASPGGRATIEGEVPSAINPPDGCAFHPRCPHARDICRTVPPEPRTVDRTLVACHLADQIQAGQA